MKTAEQNWWVWIWHAGNFASPPPLPLLHSSHNAWCVSSSSSRELFKGRKASVPTEHIHWYGCVLLPLQNLPEGKEGPRTQEPGRLLSFPISSFCHFTMVQTERHFGTFCATWWNFIGSKLSGVWVTRQRGTHLSHFLAAQYFSPKCRIPYCAQQFNCARPIIKFFFLNVKISL